MPQRNFRRTPPRVEDKIDTLGSDVAQVATIQEVELSDIQDGAYSHIGLVAQDGEVQGACMKPSHESGKFSNRNINGREVVRDDLPKVSKRIHLGERPIYGDWSNGSFELWVDREVYQKEWESPEGFEITTEILDVEEGEKDSTLVVKFSVEPPLDTAGDGFDEQLFYQLNLLQENVGEVDVYPSDASRQELLKDVKLSWEILPPGERDDLVRRAIDSHRDPDEETIGRIKERRDFFESLDPESYVVGLGGNRRYFGALFNDDLVVFENVDYGNAVYIMFADWQELSQLSRTELLNRADANFERVIHRDGWRRRVAAIVRERCD